MKTKKDYYCLFCNKPKTKSEMMDTYHFNEGYCKKAKCLKEFMKEAEGE